MKLEFERRVLLLHLGRMLQLITRVRDGCTSAGMVGELIARNPILEDEPLLAHVRSDLPVESFVDAALRAFCLWPQWLTHDPLDRDALAGSVQDNLFFDNPGGWNAYAAELRTGVAWFGVQSAPESHGDNAAGSMETLTSLTPERRTSEQHSATIDDQDAGAHVGS